MTTNSAQSNLQQWPKTKSIGQRIDDNFQYLAIIPAVLLLLLMTGYPLIQLVRMSFSTVTLAEGQFLWEFSGLDNWRSFLEDEIFLIAMRNTVVFVMVTVAVEMVLGFFLALLLRPRFGVLVR